MCKVLVDDCWNNDTWCSLVACGLGFACLPGCVQLKDEVVMLKAAVASRDAQLSAAADASAGMKSELGQYHCQVRRCSPTPGGWPAASAVSMADMAAMGGACWLSALL